ncbi:MAG: AAA family ATPase [Stellaceae bacterium]
MQIVIVGDPKQCQSIEAGPVIELLRRAIGEEAIPQILTSIRQKTEREREITSLFR